VDGVPNVLALRRAFYDAVRAEAPTWLKDRTTNGAIRKYLQRLRHFKHRDRAPDLTLAENKSKLANYVLRCLAPIEADGHAKSAYQYKSWQDMRAGALGFWDNQPFREHSFLIMGFRFKFEYVERVFQSHFGGVSPLERADAKYRQLTIGQSVEYAGQYLQLDGTGIPIRVSNPRGSARNDNTYSHYAAFLTDVASLRTLIGCEATRSEVGLWSPLLMRFFEQENYAPERLTMDEGGRGLNAIRHQEAGKPVALEKGIRLALAVGVHPHCHEARMPRGKGAVESGGVSSGKSSLKRVLVRRYAAAILNEIKHIPESYRDLSGHLEFQEIMNEWELCLNARVVKRIGDGKLSRLMAWLLPEFVARRNERALIADWKDQYSGVVNQGFCMEVRGENKLFWKGARAELRTPLGRPVSEGSVAILFPGGLRAGDDQFDGDLLRGVVIEDRQGSPRYHSIEALKVRKSFLGFEVDRPTANEHPIAMPETDHERRRRMWNTAGKLTPAALRDGTTGNAVLPDDISE